MDLQEITTTLKECRIEDVEQHRRAAISRLPKHLRSIAWQVLGYNQHGQPFQFEQWSERQKAREQAAHQLEALPTTDRLKLFEALLAKLAPYVEAAWQLQKSFPYEAGWQRRAFRAPHRPDLTLSRRSAWLTAVLAATGPYYEQDLVWFAQYAAHLKEAAGGAGQQLGLLFAAAIEQGDQAGNEVFDILVATVKGEHPIGMMGRHVPQGLLSAPRPEGWEWIERLLIAAQRQEGLRQVILETIDEAHPQAFRRMVHLIREQNLARFSSVTRAVDVWFGFQWEAAQAATVQRLFIQLDELLADEAACLAVLKTGNDPQAIYLALCVLGFADVEQALPQALRFLDVPEVETRFAATYFLAQLQLSEANEALLSRLLDEDLRVATVALNGLVGHAYHSVSPPGLFEKLEAALPRFPTRKRTLEPLVWPWLTLTADRQIVANALVNALGQRPLTCLLPYLEWMDTTQRGQVARKLVEAKQWDGPTRDTFLQLLGDRSGWVRRSILEAAATLKLSEAEIQQLEVYLTRQAGDLRRGILQILLNQPDAAVLASTARLLRAKEAQQRQAGLELLRQLKEQNRSVKQCLATAQAYTAQQSRVSETEQRLLEAIKGDEPTVFTLDDGLGLFDPAQRTRPTAPTSKQGLFKRLTFVSPAAIACPKSLDELVHQHRETPIQIQSWQGQPSEELLGNVRWGFPGPDPKQPVEEDMKRLPLAEVWGQWAANRPAALRDKDHLELLRALAPLEAGVNYHRMISKRDLPGWLKGALHTLYGGVKEETLHYAHPVQAILWWLVRRDPPLGAVNFLLDAVEHSFTLVNLKQEGRNQPQLFGWLRVARRYRSLCPEAWTKEQHLRLWRLLRWLDEPGANLGRHRPLLDDVMWAYQAGGATEADLFDQLIGPRDTPKGYYDWSGGNFPDLRNLSARKPDLRHSAFALDPNLQALVNECRRRIIAVELRRADMPTAASKPAMALRYSGGLETLLQLLQAFGTEKFVRGWAYDSASKPSVFSHLLRSTFPAAEDTPERFAARVKEVGISQKRLVETAMYAPQWATQVEYALGWPQFAEAVWWFHAHTKDNHWHVDQEIRETWNAETGERTPLSGQDLIDGAVDVAWFQRIFNTLGEKRWQELDQAAKYTSGGGGHKRAQLFAEAMLGRLDPADLIRQIKTKRHQDAVRALGLLPLPADATCTETVLARYQQIQEFVRSSRQFGSQKQANEKLAARIGLQNLARTAGYPDPLRLQWAMEAQAGADLAVGPVTATVDGVTVSLAINEWGEPQLEVSKNGRALKTVPAAVKKQADIALLFERQREIKQQAARIRQSLEQAMCRGDRFTGSELQTLLAHPVLRPLVSDVVFVGQDLLGYPDPTGQHLVGLAGQAYVIPPEASLHLAHPHDLFETGEWHLWQQECFRHERIQPFKQVFRELYLLTTAERIEGTLSRRYAGHQVNPRQALALLGQHGWVVHPEEGVRRTFHEEGLAAWLTFIGGYFTPADVEGLTLEGVCFSRRGEWQPLSLDQILPRLFSEVMRDLDLVVSVAHQGGVDPETTASTVEMRAALIRETCSMLDLTNVRLADKHAFVDGQLNHYSVHLGSGVVHQQPGGYVCIVPVHSQHRGRIFLPFADDDPRTAEVMAKVLLLARDQEIKDPTILEQIVRVGF